MFIRNESRTVWTRSTAIIQLEVRKKALSGGGPPPLTWNPQHVWDVVMKLVDGSTSIIKTASSEEEAQAWLRRMLEGMKEVEE